MFTKYKAVMFGVEGKVLTQEEANFFRATKPLGFCLFARNIESKQQVRALVDSLKAVVENSHAPILIDQEGGRVCRFRAPTWYQPPAAAVFGKIAEDSLLDASRALEISFILVAMDMAELGINVDAAPVLDVPAPGAHGVISDRAFSSDKTIVAALGRVVVETLTEYGIVPTIKHIPGHGRAEVDSHTHLPVVSASLESLKATDFYPFEKLNNAGWAMTAHVVYTAIDAIEPATFSKSVIEMIRTEVSFQGLLVTDCITMEALNGSMGERAGRSIEAGCDIVLHSRYKNFSLDVMRDVVGNVPNVNERQGKILHETLVPSSAGLKRLASYSRPALLAELNGILSKHGVELSAVFDVTADPTDTGRCNLAGKDGEL